MIMHNKFIFSILTLCLLFISCHKEEDTTTKLTLKFSFTENGNEVLLDTLLYTNAAGNLYEIDEIKYFISDLKLTTTKGETIEIQDHEGVHYIDLALPYTLSWTIADSLPIDNYAAISFRMGLTGKKNTTHYFVNPPENNMAWPETLGGGYHYLMNNGKWMKDNVLTPFNFHAGRTFNENQETADPTFITTITHPSFSLKKGQNNMVINMEVNNWFENPTIFDFNHFGGSIMTNIEAQEAIKSNGHDVFSIKF